MPLNGVIIIGFFHTLMAFLSFNRQSGNRTSLKSGDAYRLTGFFAIAIFFVFNALESFINFANQFSDSVFGAQVNCFIGFHRGAVNIIRLV